MAGKTLSTEPLIDPSARVQQATLGAYCEVGARTKLLDVALDDYSYVVNDSEITYTTIGKFCSIAAMTRTRDRKSFASSACLPNQRSRFAFACGRGRDSSC